MKNARLLPCVLFLVSACDQAGGNTQSGNTMPDASPTTGQNVDATITVTTTVAPPIASTDSGRVVVEPTTQTDARAAATNLPVSCTPNKVY
jgi:hypothetical protein